MADAVREYSDEMAERGVALGGVAKGSVQTVSRRSKLPEYRVNNGFMEVSRGIDKLLWMVKRTFRSEHARSARA